MLVKPIQPTDYERLHLLYDQLIDEKTDIEPMLRVLSETAGDDHYTLLGVYDDRDVLQGTVTLTRCLDLTGDARFYYSMENFVIAEEVRGQGYGSYLLHSAEEFIEKNDGSYVNFTSSSARTGAHSFYEKNGYSKDYVKGFKKRFPKQEDLSE